jgi:hypothetical protein
MELRLSVALCVADVLVEDLNSSAAEFAPLRREAETAMRLIRLAIVISMLSFTRYARG